MTSFLYNSDITGNSHVKNIYYSPAGEFNNISIESLQLTEDSGKTLATKYNIYRVSSTREIIGNTMPVDGRDAIVFGGLSYDTSLGELEEDSKKYTSSRAITINNPSDIDSKAIRAVIKDIPYLEGTLSEAEIITFTINASGNSILNAVSVTGPAGTEASFKALDGKNKRIIHIATHGFYLKQKEYDQIVKTSERGNDRMSGEDKSLMRSGLFFAGALNKYIGEEIPEGGRWNIDIAGNSKHGFVGTGPLYAFRLSDGTGRHQQRGCLRTSARFQKSRSKEHSDVPMESGR